MSTILYYFHDPMCSWCYAFQPVWQTIKSRLNNSIEVTYVLGGLAADDDEIMEESLQQTIQHHWQRIQQIVPGTEFNFDFWTACKPRRSTYPACRAVIAATNQGRTFEEPMIQAIQTAYYREARNPSDNSTHLQLAEDLQLDLKKFHHDLDSAETEQELMRQIRLTYSFNVSGFPSLVLTLEEHNHAVPIDYTNAEPILKIINEAL
jgi:putative protein-disulfide isomerase